MKGTSEILVAAFMFLSAVPIMRAQGVLSPSSPTILGDLLAEAERNNAQIQAARHETDASKQASTQVSTRPDPQAVLQQFSVGSPRPFAGYTNSDFAYVGLGFSQDIPYPGKLRLRGEIAKKDAEVSQQKYEAMRRAILSEVEQTYFQLGYPEEEASILGSDKDLLRQVEQSAEARYRSGAGSQQEVLQAQLEETKLLAEVTSNELDRGKAQAALKQLLGRSQSSADISAAPLAQTALPYTFEELLAAAKANNPEIAGMQKIVEREKLQVDLAKKDFDPDFNLQYMWQRTDPTQYRAYYMLTFGVNIPIHRSKLHHELAEAEANLNRSRSEADAQSQQVAFELRTEYDTAQKDAELLNIYSSGLM